MIKEDKSTTSSADAMSSKTPKDFFVQSNVSVNVPVIVSVNEPLNEEVTELSEDMELVSPGVMLYEARIALSLSQEHIANKLNFKITLVDNIEKDIFDPVMPVTFNRGYLTNYAKLVGVEVEDVLASYDALDAASLQRSEMLSFSKETSKQAEHSRVMWLSYFIVAVLFGLTILWWLQDNRQQEGDSTSTLFKKFISTSDKDAQPEDKVIKSDGEISASTSTVDTKTLSNSPESGGVAISGSLSQSTELTKLSNEPTATAEKNVDTLIDNNIVNNVKNSVTSDLNYNTAEADMSTAVFTFNGDCWVNIFDATGERIAWGVKKSGYVMTIQGKAPLRITVGKPELTSIVFNGQQVDMSAFNKGNIAKFNLPDTTE